MNDFLVNSALIPESKEQLASRGASCHLDKEVVFVDMELFWLNGYIPNESSSCLTLYQTLLLRYFCRYWMNLDWHFISNFQNAEQSGCHINSMSDVFWALLLVIVKCKFFIIFASSRSALTHFWQKRICIISLFDNCILAGPGRMWPSRWGFSFGIRVHLDTGRNRLLSLRWPSTLWAAFSRAPTREVGSEF